MASARSRLFAFVFSLALAAPALAQRTEVITLENGASFEGTAVLETDLYLDLNIGQGRIRISKAWIKTRTKMGAPDVTSSAKPGAGGNRAQDEAPRPERPAFPAWLKDGASAILPLRNLHRYHKRPTTGEEAALNFCRHFQQAKAGDVVETLSNPVRVLESAFPNAARGLTSYSRRLAGKLFMRVVVATCAQPGIREALGHARLTARRMASEPGFERIEVSFHIGEGEEPVVIQIDVDDGRIVGLTKGPPPIPQAIEQIAAALKLAGDKPYQLVPLLEAAVEAEVTRSLPGGARSDAGKAVARAQREVWHLRPKERRYVLTLPWTWEPAEDDETPSYADFLLRAAKNRCAATAVSESGVLPLAELERVALEQLKKSHVKIEIVDKKEIALGGSRALRMRVETTGGEEALTYELLLLVIQNRACQFAAWCKTSEHEELAPTLESLFEGLRFLN